MEQSTILLILMLLFLGLQLIYLANFILIRNSKVGQQYLNMYRKTHQFYLFFNYFKKANNIINNYLGNTNGYYINFKFLRVNPSVTNNNQGYLAIKDNNIDFFIFSNFIINFRNITNETKLLYYSNTKYIDFYINKTLFGCYNTHSHSSVWISPEVTHINNSSWENTTFKNLVCAKEHIGYTSIKRNIKYMVLLAFIGSMILGNFKSYSNGTYMAVFVPRNKKLYYTTKIILKPGEMRIILKNYLEVDIYRNNTITYDFVKSLALKKLRPILARTKVQNNTNKILIYSGPNGIFIFLWPKFSKSFGKFFNNTTVYAVCRSRKNIENINIVGEGEWISQNFQL